MGFWDGMLDDGFFDVRHHVLEGMFWGVYFRRKEYGAF